MRNLYSTTAHPIGNKWRSSTFRSQANDPLRLAVNFPQRFGRNEPAEFELEGPMRMMRFGWASLGLAIAVLLGYILNRGVFVSADVELLFSGGPPWPKYCNYLHWGGISQEAAKAANDVANAEATACPFLKTSD